MKTQKLITTIDKEKLKTICNKLMNDYRPEVEPVFLMIIDELEKRMNKKEFIKYCDSL